MPHYRIHVSSSDRAVESPDPEGIVLGSVGLLRALVVETLVEAARDRPAPGTTRTITATACDAAGALIYSDRVDVAGPRADDAAVGRTIQAMSGRP